MKTKTPVARPIVVVGSANTDLIARCERLPGPGETLLGGEFSRASGGKGANQAVAAALLGGRVRFVARLGRDALGARLLRELRGRGVDVSKVTKDRILPSGVALILVGSGGENSIVVASGANGALSVADVRAAAGAIKRAGVLVLQLETPLESVLEAARLARAAGVTVILNPAPARELPHELLRCVDLLTPNEHEASLLTGLRITGAVSAAKAARRLRELGVGTVVVTLGAKGVYVSSPGLEGAIPGFKVKAVDSTAAGDVFNGALAACLARGEGLRDALRFSQAAAAISVTRPGAQPSIPSLAEVRTWLAAVA